MREINRPDADETVSKQRTAQQEQNPLMLMAVGFILAAVSLIAYIFFGQPLL